MAVVRSCSRARKQTHTRKRALVSQPQPLRPLFSPPRAQGRDHGGGRGGGGGETHVGSLLCVCV